MLLLAEDCVSNLDCVALTAMTGYDWKGVVVFSNLYRG